jgi:RNA polymerase sigma-70 factor (family 1)
LKKEEFKLLFDKYFDDVRRYILYRSGNEELATDIAQDTFMRVWEKQINIDKRTVKGLLFKIANDFFISDYRHKKVEYSFFDTFEPNQKSLTPEDEYNFKELKIAYETALKTMPEKQRTVFLMNRIDELKYREIAVQLDLSVKAIEKRMSLALEHLKKELGSRLKTPILFVINFFRQKIRYSEQEYTT